jgi:hypothetical protein
VSGFVTEKHLDEADEAFPGIRDFWNSLTTDTRPKTFLELMTLFLTTEN